MTGRLLPGRNLCGNCHIRVRSVTWPGAWLLGNGRSARSSRMCWWQKARRPWRPVPPKAGLTLCLDAAIVTIVRLRTAIVGPGASSLLVRAITPVPVQLVRDAARALSGRGMIEVADARGGLGASAGMRHDGHRRPSSATPSLTAPAAASAAAQESRSTACMRTAAAFGRASRPVPRFRRIRGVLLSARLAP